MTELDQKMYQIFADKTLSDGCMIFFPYINNFYKKICGFGKRRMGVKGIYIQNGVPNGPHYGGYTIIGHEPQLHDVFMVAKDRGYNITISDGFGGVIGIINGLRNNNIPYKPTLPLMSQSDEVKQQLINLFS